MEDRLEIWLELIGGKLDRLIEIGESLEGQVRLPSEDESKTFSGAKDPAKERSLDGLPDIRTFAQRNLRWRILEPGEVVCSSDWVNAKSNLPSDPPSGLGWRPAIVSAGLTVLKSDGCVYARPVADEPAKEPEPPEPPEPEYREPVLPADLGKWAEFSHDGINWTRHKLRGCHKESEATITIWSEEYIGFRHCRIKKDA